MGNKNYRTLRSSRRIGELNLRTPGKSGLYCFNKPLRIGALRIPGRKDNITTLLIILAEISLLQIGTNPVEGTNSFDQWRDIVNRFRARNKTAEKNI